MIPATFHRIWIGPRQMPAAQHRWIAEAQAIHHDWTHRLWTESELAGLLWPAIARAWRQANATHKSDIGGYLLVYRFGGVYCDTDYRWLRPIGRYLQDCPAFVCQTDRGVASASIFGAEPGHGLFRRALELIPRRFRADRQLSTTRVLEEAARGREDVRRFERRLFIPVRFAERARLETEDDFPGSCAVHQFAASWVGRVAP